MSATSCLLQRCHGKLQARPLGAGLLGSQPRARRQPAYHGNPGNSGKASVYPASQRNRDKESMAGEDSWSEEAPVQASSSTAAKEAKAGSLSNTHTPTK